MTRLRLILRGILDAVRRYSEQSVLIALLFACFQAWNTQYEAAGNNQNRFAMKELLNTAISEGEVLNKDWFKRTDADAYLHEANIWTNKTGHLIEDAYGKGEVAIWMSVRDSINQLLESCGGTGVPQSGLLSRTSGIGISFTPK